MLPVLVDSPHPTEVQKGCVIVAEDRIESIQARLRLIMEETRKLRRDLEGLIEHRKRYRLPAPFPQDRTDDRSVLLSAGCDQDLNQTRR
jgi:hypothetical protein